MFRELNEGLAYLTAIDFNDPGLRDHGAFRCPGAHAIFSVCMRVCVCARAPQAEGGVHRPGRYGGHPSQVCAHAGSVYVCVCTPVRVPCPSLHPLLTCACLYQGELDACVFTKVHVWVWLSTQAHGPQRMCALVPCRCVFDAHARMGVGLCIDVYEY